MCESKLGVYRSSIVNIIATTAVVMKIKVKITYTYKYKNELALFSNWRPNAQQKQIFTLK